MMSQEKEKGNVLLEAIIAMAVILIVIASIATVITLGVSNSTYVKNQNNANKIAQDGLEYILTMHNRNTTIELEDASEQRQKIYVSDLSGDPYCFGEDYILKTGSCNPNIDDIFIREVTFIQGECGDPLRPLEGGTQVNVEVSWVSGRCPESDRFCHKAHLVSCVVRSNSNTNP